MVQYRGSTVSCMEPKKPQECDFGGGIRESAFFSDRMLKSKIATSSATACLYTVCTSLPAGDAPPNSTSPMPSVCTPGCPACRTAPTRAWASLGGGTSALDCPHLPVANRVCIITRSDRLQHEPRTPFCPACVFVVLLGPGKNPARTRQWLAVRAH